MKKLIIILLLVMSYQTSIGGEFKLFINSSISPKILTQDYSYSYNELQPDGSNKIVDTQEETQVGGLGIGLAYKMNAIEAQSQITTLGSNRHNIESSIFFYITNNIKIGIGITHHKNIKYTYITKNTLIVDGEVIQLGEKNELVLGDSKGHICEISYILEEFDFISIGLKYTNIKYKYDEGFINGSNIALIVGIYF